MRETIINVADAKKIIEENTVALQPAKLMLQKAAGRRFICRI